MNNFTNNALEKLLDLYYEHSHEVGSQLKKNNPYEYEALKATDCITYVINVLSYAFKKENNNEAAYQVKTLGAYGTKLAKYLVEEQNFKAIYINPDITHPKDGDEEHTYSAHIAHAKCNYYDVPIKYKIINYNPTSSYDNSFNTLNKNEAETILEEDGLNALKNVEFAFGVSRGGRHTWLFSKGKVYEVHWNSIGDDLYEASELIFFNWLSSIIVIPEDQEKYLEGISPLKCYK